MKNTRLLALTGILSALSVVLLFFGSVVTIFAYVMPLVCGILMIILNDVSKKHSWIMFVVVSIISVFLLPDKECPLTYAFFFGYYPIIRERLSEIGNKFVLYIIKLLIFNVGIILSQLLCFYVFLIPFDSFLGKWGVIIMILLAELVFVVYERLLSVLCLLYDKKFRKKVTKFLK